jgi:hypothetical protein
MAITIYTGEAQPPDLVFNHPNKILIIDNRPEHEQAAAKAEFDSNNAAARVRYLLRRAKATAERAAKRRKNKSGN